MRSKYIIGLIFLVMVGCSLGSASVITTYNASNISIGSVSLSGSIADNYTDDVWFEYGVSSDYMNFATERWYDLEGEANFSFNLTAALYEGKTYYYKAVSLSNGYGEVKVFTVPTPSPGSNELVSQVFDDEMERFEIVDESEFEFEVLAPLVSAAYTSLWGFWIYGFIWAGIFAAFWLRQEDVTIPTFLYIILSYSIVDYIPAAWMPFIYGSLVLSIVGMIYILFRGWRNG